MPPTPPLLPMLHAQHLLAGLDGGGDGSHLPPGSPPTVKFEGPWFKTQLILSAAIGITAFLLFSYCRTRWPLLFAPRTKLKGKYNVSLPAWTHRAAGFSPHEAHAHQAFFGWIMPTVRTSELTVLQIVGLDAAVLLNFFRTAFQLFSVCSMFAITILMPLNWKHNKDLDLGDDDDWPSDGDDWPLFFLSPSIYAKARVLTGPLGGPNSTFPFPGKDWLDLISDADSYLSVHLAFTYLFTLLALYFIYKNYRRFIRSRQLFSLELVHSIPARTVLVTGLPKHLQGERPLAEYFENMNLAVESVTVCREVGSLKNLIDLRTMRLLELEKAWVDYVGNPSTVEEYDPETSAMPLVDTDIEGDPPTRFVVPHKPRPTLRPSWFSLKVDALEYLEKRFREADELVKKKRRMGRFRATGSAFVTFEKMSSAQIAVQTAHTASPFQLTTYPAPEPRDIVWANMTPSTSVIRLRDIIVLFLMALLLSFWFIPITGLASLLSYKEIKKAMPWLGKLIDANGQIRAIVQNSLPSVAMITLNALLPFMLEALTYIQGFRARSWVEYSLLKKYFLFLLINVVFIFLLATTYWQLVRDLANTPAKVPEKLAVALQAGRARHFFLSYVILQGLGIMPLQLLNLGVIIPRAVFRLFWTRTPRDFAELNAPPMINYGVVYPQAILMFVITMLYSVQQPLIVIFGAIYFGVGYVVYKYKLLFVFYKPYESRGQAWPITFIRLIWGVVIFLLFMTGIFTLRKSWVLSSLLIPLLFGTVAWSWYIDKKLKPLTKYVSLSSVFEVQRGEETADVTKLRAGHPVTWSQSNLNRRRYAQNDDTLYVAPEDERTDYSQPPMANWYSGVLNTGKRRYGHPALNGVLPEPWLPLKKGQTLINHNNGIHNNNNGHSHNGIMKNIGQTVVLTLRKRYSNNPRSGSRGGAPRTQNQSQDFGADELPEIPIDAAAVPNPWGDLRSSLPPRGRHIASSTSALRHRLSYDHGSGVIMLPDDPEDWLDLVDDDDDDSDEEHHPHDPVSDDAVGTGGNNEDGDDEGGELEQSVVSLVSTESTAATPVNAHGATSPSRMSRYGTYWHHPERRRERQSIPGAFPR